jgi:hypothetical protein
MRYRTGLIEDYLDDLTDRWKPSTVTFQYRSLHSA